MRAILSDRDRAFDGITGIIEPASGDLWLNSALGIVHVAASELRRAVDEPAHRASSEVFGLLDGFAGNSARIRPLPTAVEGADGRLWFASNVGVFSIDPARIRRNAVPPNMLIQGLIANTRSYAPLAPIVLPQGTRSLRIDYVGLSVGTPERVRYRYRLKGVDKDWQDAQSRQQAFYTNLDPGHYEFNVIGSSSDGVWSPTGAAVAFTIAPTFMQTGWFALLCVMVVAAALFLVLRMRVRQIAARMRWRLDAQLAERDRIARELHDTLLQSTQGLILRFQAVANRIGNDDPNRAMLDSS